MGAALSWPHTAARRRAAVHTKDLRPGDVLLYREREVAVHCGVDSDVWDHVQLSSSRLVLTAHSVDMSGGAAWGCLQWGGL